jgi:hypothetical protein
MFTFLNTVDTDKNRTWIKRKPVFVETILSLSKKKQKRRKKTREKEIKE